MAQEVPPSREEWQEWKAHPVTQWYRWALGEIVASYRNDIGRGMTLRANSDDTAQETARFIGVTMGLELAIDAEPEAMS